jgi:4-amino-4-deoxy-L-arabinose transferase-like glycosyltransferase
MRLATIRRHWAITGIIVAFITLGVTYSVVTPIFEASDELWHYPFVKHLADGNGLPVQDANADQPWRQEGSQPPLYYALSALATFWIDTSDAYEGHPPLPWHNPHVDNGLLTADGNTNLVVHSQQEAFPWHGTTLAVHLIRLLSVLMGVATVLLTYLITLEVFPGREDLALGAAAVNAFTPMFLFISGAVNNDNLVMPLCSLALLMMVRMANRKPVLSYVEGSQISIVRWALLGLVIGLAILTKESAIGLLALAGLTITYITYRQRSLPTLLQGGLIVVGLAGILSGWWFFRNWKLYGDPLGLNIFLDILGRRHPPATLRQLWGEREGFAMSYWGLFGGVNVPMDAWVYRLLNLLAMVAALGVIILLIRKLIRDRLQLEAWVQTMILLAWPTIVFVSLIRWALQTWSSQGRLVFSAISALSILLFLGLSQFVPRRYTKMLACLIAGLMFVISAVAPFRYIAPAYARPPLLSETDIRAIPNRLDISFGGVMKLLGYNWETGGLVNWETGKLVDWESLTNLPIYQSTSLPVYQFTNPGDSLTITLYWQSLAEMNQDYSTFVHLLDENELIVAQRDMYPGQGLYPTSLWSVGDTIANRYVLILPETAFAPNRAQLEVGLYDFATGQRLLAYGPNGELLGDNARFQEIEIMPRTEAEVPNPVHFNFGNRIALVGYNMDRRTASPGETIHLILYWQALSEMEENYTVFTHVLGEENRIWAQHDNWPKNGDAPTSTWEPGQTIADEHELAIYADTPPAVYDVEIGLYLAETGDRLRIVGQGGRLLDDRVLLSKVRVK